MEVRSRQILSLLELGELDLGVLLEPVSREDYVAQPAVRSEIVAVVSRDHPLAGAGSVSFSRLRTEPLLMISQEFMFSGVVESLCREAGFEPQVAFEWPSTGRAWRFSPKRSWTSTPAPRPCACGCGSLAPRGRCLWPTEKGGSSRRPCGIFWICAGSKFCGGFGRRSRRFCIIISIYKG